MTAQNKIWDFNKIFFNLSCMDFLVDQRQGYIWFKELHTTFKYCLYRGARKRCIKQCIGYFNTMINYVALKSSGFAIQQHSVHRPPYT